MGRTVKKVKELEAKIKNPSTMVIYKHVDVADTRFATMLIPLVNIPMEKCLELIIRGTQKGY